MAIPSAAPVRRDRLIIALAYSLAWGAVLVNRGLYWDDWTSIGRTTADILQGVTELGQPLAALVFVPLLALPLPGLVGHIVVFGAYLGSTLVLHAILRRLPGLSRMDALVAALAFALLPVNYARIALADIMYGLSLLAFLVATWLLIRFVEDGGRARRVAALVLFVLSFYTASLLVLYVVPVAVAAVLLIRSEKVPLRSIALRHLDFLALPVAFWLVKSALFKPFGAYDGYNELTSGGVLNVPKAMLAVPREVLIEPLSRAVSVAGVAGVVAGIAVGLWLVRRGRDAETGRFVPAAVLALIGAAMVVLGVFAYLAVGLVPTIWDWSSRHQLLVPLGAGLLAAAAARGVGALGHVGRAGGLAVVGLLLGISMIADARTLIAYQVDWFKQQALIEAVRTGPELQTAGHIRVIDSATAMNAMRRTYRFYELNALFREATGNTRRLVALAGKDPAANQLPIFIARPGYQMSEYAPSPVDLELIVSPGREPHGLDVLRLVALEAVGSPSFGTEVLKLVDIRVTPVGGAP